MFARVSVSVSVCFTLRSARNSGLSKTTLCLCRSAIRHFLLSVSSPRKNSLRVSGTSFHSPRHRRIIVGTTTGFITSVDPFISEISVGTFRHPSGESRRTGRRGWRVIAERFHVAGEMEKFARRQGHGESVKHSQSRHGIGRDFKDEFRAFRRWKRSGRYPRNRGSDIYEGERGRRIFTRRILSTANRRWHVGLTRPKHTDGTDRTDGTAAPEARRSGTNPACFLPASARHFSRVHARAIPRRAAPRLVCGERDHGKGEKYFSYKLSRRNSRTMRRTKRGHAAST